MRAQTWGNAEIIYPESRVISVSRGREPACNGKSINQWQWRNEEYKWCRYHPVLRIYYFGITPGLYSHIITPFPDCFPTIPLFLWLAWHSILIHFPPPNKWCSALIQGHTALGSNRSPSSFQCSFKGSLKLKHHHPSIIIFALSSVKDRGEYPFWQQLSRAPPGGKGQCSCRNWSESHPARLPSPDMSTNSAPLVFGAR